MGAKSGKPTPTNAASSGIKLDRNLTKRLMQRSARPDLAGAVDCIAAGQRLPANLPGKELRRYLGPDSGLVVVHRLRLSG
jgi:hypothetical protein